ncbi:MAG: thioredoxin family protein [Odoribacter splanchnicus]
MKKLIFLFSLFIAFQAVAQEGIRFRHCSWEEAKAMAKKEKKPIFIDFYTQWCGPCLNMAENIFTLGSVGNFYNDHFVCLKIDAETGEGVELAKKYEVASFPTFVFVNPKTEKAIHISGSNQDRETFLFTGASALDPKKTSIYLTEQKKIGNNKPEFLLDYAYYAASRYNRTESEKCAEQLITKPGYSLENPKVWALFVKSIHGRENKLFKTLCSNIDKYRKIHGAQAVDSKLFKECNYCPDAAELAALPDFEGKEFLTRKNEADRLINAEKYEEAARIIDQMMANPGAFREELCMYFRFMTRSATYKDYPEFWKEKCLEYSRYMAYNMPNRDEATTHFDYANQLEHFIRTNPEIQKHLPEFLQNQPTYGVKEYSMRPEKLKAKPKRH